MAKIMMVAIQIVVTLTFLAVITADKVPVLMWSQSRPLHDLPQAFAGNSIDGQTFHQKYLSPLTSKQGHSVVAFVQDKLHMEDFSKYADVYNPFSDGGAFKNIKNLMDDNFSVNLPAVHSPKDVIDSLMKEFKGRVHSVSSPEHVSGLKMEKDKSYLILVLLPATGQKNEEKAISKNDEKVGEIVKALNKRSIDYTALFTGERAERDTKATFKGRHLLENPDNVTGIFANVSGEMYFYSRGIQVVIVQRGADDKNTRTVIDFPKESGAYSSNESSWVNNTATFVLSTDNAVSNTTAEDHFQVMFKFTAVKNVDRWTAVNFTLSVTNTSSNSEVIVDEQDMSLKDTEMAMPPIFSYHCSDLTLYPMNKTNDKEYALLKFDGLQFQPFGVRNDQFSEAWDCVGFFTTPILMGLVPVGIFTVILFMGMYMISQLSTMDRFDDPKGKTITVNVNE
ncbi:V-type proton ATPase subunit S1-like [Haliotis rubra]|uniref:V-type proton ATPase subunit S1-like n=1 Tax=Haliotis rubra TaxID=36100 RepID=UPI001EE59FF1|nr:V-type proton ATPase subunit S1-like [Haliotis rubra]